MTSHACLPIDPVAPSRTTRRRCVNWVTCARMPQYRVEQSTPALSPRLRECDQLQIAIYDRSYQHKAVGTVQERAVPRDERSRVFDICLTLDRRLDEIATLGVDRDQP